MDQESKSCNGRAHVPGCSQTLAPPLLGRSSHALLRADEGENRGDAAAGGTCSPPVAMPSGLTAAKRLARGGGRPDTRRRARTRVETALRSMRPTPAQRNILATYRRVVEGYHRDRDPFLFGGAAEFVEHLLHRDRHNRATKPCETQLQGEIDVEDRNERKRDQQCNATEMI